MRISKIMMVMLGLGFLSETTLGMQVIPEDCPVQPGTDPANREEDPEVPRGATVVTVFAEQLDLEAQTQSDTEPAVEEELIQSVPDKLLKAEVNGHAGTTAPSTPDVSDLEEGQPQVTGPAGLTVEDRPRRDDWCVRHFGEVFFAMLCAGLILMCYVIAQHQISQHPEF